jgi:hypothetical protein
MRLLSWALLPFSTCRWWGSTWGTGLPHPLGATCRVWLPSWWFTPPTPWSALSHADSARGIWFPSELSPSQRYRATFPPVMDPRAVCLAESSAANKCGRGAGEPRLLGFDPLGSPLAEVGGLAPKPGRMLPWVWSLPGCSLERLADDSAPAPPSHFGKATGLRRRDPCASEYRWPFAWPGRDAWVRQAGNRATLLGFAYRFYLPFKPETAWAYGFTSQGIRHY